MTTRIVTRADGTPAYLNARPRRRQSDVNRKRSYAAMYREMQAEEAHLARAAGDQPQRSTLRGIGYTVGFIVGFIGTFAVVFASLA